jgi:hypothetical protein
MEDEDDRDNVCDGMTPMARLCEASERTVLVSQRFERISEIHLLDRYDVVVSSRPIVSKAVTQVSDFSASARNALAVAGRHSASAASARPK